MGFVGRLDSKDLCESTHGFVIIKHAKELLLSHSVMSNSLWSHDYSPPGSRHFPGKNTGVVVLLQAIIPTQGSNPSLLSPTLAGRFFTTGIASTIIG